MKLLRLEKLNGELKRNIYDILSTKVKDPRLTEIFSITKVSCDTELTYARIFVSIFSLDESKAEATFKAIKSSAGYVRKTLYKSMRIRAVPELDFVLDNTMVEGDKIDKILYKIKNEKEDN